MAKKQGAPFKYKTAKDLQNKIDDYFNNGIRKKSVIVGKGDNKKEAQIEVPTISGLCYFLGFASRQSFYDMEKTEHLSYTIKRCRLFIETIYEEMLHEGNVTGAIFALKNFGWTDKQEIQQDTTLKIETVRTIDEIKNM